ncbi:MAG: hypothetical protein HY908_04025 [Myxococcales bacterium]|nr:hypothetical protein [Myxococcales bacterium]
MDTGILVAGLVALALFGLVAAVVVLVRRWGKRFEPEGALAEASLDTRSRIELRAPAGEALDLFLHYTMLGARRSGGGIAYGMVMRLDVERAPAAGHSSESSRGFLYEAEYLLGQAQRPFGEVRVAEPMAAGPWLRSGLQVRRGLLLLRVPAGGELVARGHVAMTGATECQGLVLFARPHRT